MLTKLFALPTLRTLRTAVLFELRKLSHDGALLIGIIREPGGNAVSGWEIETDPAGVL